MLGEMVLLLLLMLGWNVVDGSLGMMLIVAIAVSMIMVLLMVVLMLVGCV